MKILIIGGGGREHALAAALAKSPRVKKIYCAPGNAGIAEVAECHPVEVMNFLAVLTLARQLAPDLVVIGPDDPLVGGLTDVLANAGFRVFGPNKEAAQLEGSKAYAKALMKKYGIPTAAYEVFDEAGQAYEYLKSATFPLVLKADGLALGKGVLICQDLAEAQAGVKAIMEDKQFGRAGNRLVIEECLVGREVSVLAFVAGKTVRTMASAQDHKRIGDGDSGKNTGGMGTFSPSPYYTGEVASYCQRHIFQATVDALQAEGVEYTGIIFFGLMLTAEGPRVLEYNARFGDPEAQVVLPRMENDLLEVMEACLDGRLADVELYFADNAAVCVVLASQGYPEQYEKGLPISGLERFAGKEDYFCFHAGTALKDGEVVTNGGRVLGVAALGANLAEARDKAYQATAWVEFAGKYMRTDIGQALR
ncbi:MAG: phosphoribosylamine--glycine ligase [Lachnospiraceae bacterium]|jgi:phosphoribosylamine--glycine ligase|nr:phosphoribosylamine--glycine ligase [Lachnospiraceae bacterium]